MAFETKVLLASMFKYVCEIDDEGARRKMIKYIQDLANVEGMILEYPKDETDS